MRWFARAFVLSSLALVATLPACSCDNNGAGGGGDGGVRMEGDGSVVIGSISVDPADATLDLVQGQAPPTQAYKVIFHGAQSDDDVTAKSTFMVVDTTLGVFNGNVFTAGAANGGTSTVVANYTPAGGSPETAQATIHVRVHGSFSDGSCTTGCNTFPASGAAACAAGAEATVVYPNEGVLLPPNLNALEIQFVPGAGDTLFEVDFENAATDVRLVTQCNPTMDTRNQPSGGCQVDLTPAAWTFIADSNKGGDPINVTVRATTDGQCASPSKNTSHMAITEQDIAGGIYYWKSTVSPNGTGGDIWRKSFGDAKPEEKISPTGISNFTCVGCHFLSRDGQRMALSGDDNDSDDEYGDVSSGLVDVGAQKFLTMTGYGSGQAPGLQTFNHDHSLYLSSNGNGSNYSEFARNGTNAGKSNVFFEWNGANGNAANPPFVALGNAGERPTMPDWSADDKLLTYVVGQSPTVPPGPAWFNNHKDDDHLFAGSIWQAPYTGNGMFGTPVEIVKSNGDNNYYPSYSPDGQFLIYNKVPLQGAMTDLFACANGLCPNDSFSNPKARIFILPIPNGSPGTPLDCEQANGSPASAPVDVSNSWPRWSPFIQTYKGNKLLWVTFSSTRDYGLRVRNHVQVGGQNQIQCYPADTPETYPVVSHSTQFADNCQQPQLWMAAINLTTAEVPNAADPSYPAFWLPFQDITTHNHTAQWTQSVVTMPTPPDGGACIPGGGDCTKNPSNCCADAPVCTANGVCGIL